MVGAQRFRNPDDDLPTDFALKRQAYYEALGLPLDGEQFIAGLQQSMGDALAAQCAMQIAYNARLNSGCISRQVGAVVTDEYFSIKSVGWNNTPQGQVPCILRNSKSLIEHDDKSAYSDYENNNNKFRQIIENNFGHKKIADKENILQGRHLSSVLRI